MSDAQKRLDALAMIADDATTDAENLEDAAFDGEVVGRNLGQIYASIRALALIIREDLVERAL